MKEEMREALVIHIYNTAIIISFVFFTSTAGVLIAKYIKWLWSVL
jgi:hypothetical protein